MCKDEISKHNQTNLNNKWRGAGVVLMLLCFVFAISTYFMLVQPAITMPGTLVCDLFEHIHIDDCHERILDCSYDNTTNSDHITSCYRVVKTRILICAETENSFCGHGGDCCLYSHNDNCYDEEIYSYLDCKDDCKPDEHNHNDECFAFGDITCPLLVHEHNDDCFEEQELECADYCYGAGCYVCQLPCCDNCLIDECDTICCAACSQIGFLAGAPGSSDLRNFVGDVFIIRECGCTYGGWGCLDCDFDNKPFTSGDPYTFRIYFWAWDAHDWWFEYDENCSDCTFDGCLTYELPPELDVSVFYNANLFFSDGEYTFIPGGFIHLRYTDDDMLTLNSFLDFELDFDAILFAEGGEDIVALDFGNGFIINVKMGGDDQGGEKKLSVEKSTDQTGDFVAADADYVLYTITIKNEGGSRVDDIIITDFPSIKVHDESSDFWAPPQVVPITTPQNVFGNFIWEIYDKAGDFLDSEVAYVQWEYGPDYERPWIWTEYFKSVPPGFSLMPGETLLFSYMLNVERLKEQSLDDITDNPLNYDFNLDNTVIVTSTADTEIDNVDLNFHSDFAFEKTGTPMNIDGKDYIEWRIVIGGSEKNPAASSKINGATIHDQLLEGLKFDNIDDIEIYFYNQPIGNHENAWQEVKINQAYKLSNMGGYSLGGFGGDQGYDTFSFVVPDSFGVVTRMEIVYRSDAVAALPGQTSKPNRNRITFDEYELEAVVGVPMKDAPRINKSLVHKTDENVEYKVEFTVLSGQQGSQYFIRDTLDLSGLYLFEPDRVAINTLKAEHFTVLVNGQPMPSGLYHIDVQPKLHEYSHANAVNMWEIYFGNKLDPFSSSIENRTLTSWPYDEETTISIIYSIPLDSRLSGSWDTRTVGELLRRAIGRYLHNEARVMIYDEDWYNERLDWYNKYQGHITFDTLYYNVVRDWVHSAWPIAKSCRVNNIANKNLFHYVVELNGENIGRIPLFEAGKPALFKDSFDPRLSYVPDSLKIWFNDVYYNAPPALEAVFRNSEGVIEFDFAAFTEPGTDWYTRVQRINIYYDLRVDPAKIIDDTVFENRAQIVATAQKNAVFYADNRVNYVSDLLSKVMRMHGSMNTLISNSNGPNVIDVEIIINPHGATLGDGLETITATDTMGINLAFLTDTIRFFEKVGDSWIPRVVSEIPGEPWSINSISPQKTEFLIPDETPVRIMYSALVTAPRNTQSPLENTIEVEGSSLRRTARVVNYRVNNTNAASSFLSDSLIVNKKDGNTGRDLTGAEFVLYFRYLDGSPLTGDTETIDGQVFRRVRDITIGANGKAEIRPITKVPPTQDPRYLLYLLVETKAPDGYDLPMNPYTYFAFPGADITAIPNAQIVADVITVYNTRPGGNLTINKTVTDSSDKNVFNFTIMDNENNPVNLTTPWIEINRSGNLSGGQFSLSHGASVTIKGLPPGMYTVIEDNTGYYTVFTIDGLTYQTGNEADINIEVDTTSEMTFINTTVGGPKLPETGGRGRGIFWLIGLLSIILCALTAIRYFAMLKTWKI